MNTISPTTPLVNPDTPFRERRESDVHENAGRKPLPTATPIAAMPHTRWRPLRDLQVDNLLGVFLESGYRP